MEISPGFLRARTAAVNLKQADKKFLARESDAEDIQVARTSGSFVYDVRGRKYIDFLAGFHEKA